MKVLCYVDGDAAEGDVFQHSSPDSAACYFAAFRAPAALNIVVEPIDDEAGALPGWTVRPDGARVRMFVVTPRAGIRRAREVQSFDAPKVDERDAEIARLRGELAALRKAVLVFLDAEDDIEDFDAMVALASGEAVTR